MEIHKAMFFLGKRKPEFRGYVDASRDGRISGWVYDRFRPRKRLDVEIYSAGSLVGTNFERIFFGTTWLAPILAMVATASHLRCPAANSQKKQWPRKWAATNFGCWIAGTHKPGRRRRQPDEFDAARLAQAAARSLFPSDRELGYRNRRAVATRMAGEHRPLRLSRIHRA